MRFKPIPEIIKEFNKRIESYFHIECPKCEKCSDRIYFETMWSIDAIEKDHLVGQFNVCKKCLPTKLDAFKFYAIFRYKNNLDCVSKIAEFEKHLKRR